MKRQVTPAEREILLANPELVMFEPYGAMKSHRVSLGKSLLLPAAVAVVFFAFGFVFPEFCSEHPNLFAGIGGTALIISCAFLPVHYWILDDHEYNEALETHYVQYLNILMPDELECNTAIVNYVTYEKCEGGWTVDGREESFGYSSCVNIFKLVPQTKVAFVSNGKGFFAFIRRDPRTECFYS